MLKTKIFTGLIMGIVGILSMVVPARAIDTQVSIQKLPSYIKYNSFILSCSAISDSIINGNPTNAQFYFEKNGGGFSAFGSAIDVTNNPCRVQVTNGQITEEANYTFRVTVDGVSDYTSTIYDNSGPSPVSGYYKEGLSDGYKLHWTNPSDSDFSMVIIYRGDSAGFTADSSHEVTKLPSGAGSPMTYDNHFSMDPSKTYYYYIRAIDKAGNDSALVGDSGTTTVTTSPIAGTGGTVTQLPKELGTGGSVLGTEASPTPQAGTTVGSAGGVVNQINQFAGKTPEPLKWILTHKKISLGILVILSLLAYNFYRAGKKDN